MRQLRKCANVLRWIGIVMICVSVVFFLYNLANTGAGWAAVSGKLTADGVQLNLIDRIHFDSTVFNAMAWSEQHRDEPNRTATVVGMFSRFTAMDSAADGVRVQRSLDASVAYLTGEFDREAFMARYESRAESEEQRREEAAISALDALAAPKGGKKLPAAVQKSCAEDMATIYAELQAAHGEAVGTYAEFLETVLAMITEANAGGAEIKDAAAYARSMEWDSYAAQLVPIQTADRTAGESLLDQWAQLCETMANGGEAEVRGFITAVYAELQTRYPNETLPDVSVCAQAVIKCLENGSFDGSYDALLAAVRTASVTANAESWRVFLNNWCEDLAKSADERAVIGFISGFWWLVARYLLWIVIGAVLIIVCKLTIYITDRIMISAVKDMGVSQDEDVLLRVDHLSQYFRSGSYVNKAVNDVSFYIKKGEVFGLVGESGCGKTTTGRTIINLYDPTTGDVYFNGLRISSTMNGLPVYRRQKRNELKQNIEALKTAAANTAKKDPQAGSAMMAELPQKIRDLKKQYAADITEAEKHALQSYVEKSRCVELFREKRKEELTAAYEKEIKELAGEAAEERTRRYHTEMKVAAKDNIMTRMQMIFQDPIASINPRMTVREIIAEGLQIRGVTDKKYINDKVNEMLELVGLVPEHADRYPHEFSGGQRQRIGIARAIIMQPELIIADEPISALDVSIQAQVINLLNDLRNNMGLTIMFIAHNLSVVKYFSDRIGVMYFGNLVELATSDELFEHPLHPYTRSLLSAIPYPDPHHEKNRKRITYDPHTTHDYSTDKPTLREIRPGHFVSCNDAEFEAYKKELGE